MNAQLQPMSELTEKATNLLVRELGVVETLRFLNSMRTGGGDYTAERERLFEGETVESIVAAIKARRA